MTEDEKKKRYSYRLKSDTGLWKKACDETAREEAGRDARMKPFLSKKNSKKPD